MNNNQLAAFEKQNYINVETKKRDGTSVKTPVWFVQDGDCLYVRTVANSGKMKRLRNFKNIRIAPCDARGSLLGEWVDAQGLILKDEAEIKRIDRLVTQKYGLMKRMFDLLGVLRRDQYGAFKITLPQTEK